jgi:hypothetical protein
MSRPPKVDYPDCVRAGKWLERIILQQSPTRTRWAESHRLAPNTILLICDGRYNSPAYVSVNLAWTIALACTKSETAARFFLYQWLEQMGVVPALKDVNVMTELAQIEAQINDVRKFIVAEQHKAEYTAKRKSPKRKYARAEFVPGEFPKPDPPATLTESPPV